MRRRQNDRLVLKGAGFSLFPQRIQRCLLNCVNWHHLKGHSWEGICALQVSYNFVSITNIYLIFRFFSPSWNGSFPLCLPEVCIGEMGAQNAVIIESVYYTVQYTLYTVRYTLYTVTKRVYTTYTVQYTTVNTIQCTGGRMVQTAGDKRSICWHSLCRDYQRLQRGKEDDFVAEKWMTVMRKIKKAMHCNDDKKKC